MYFQVLRYDIQCYFAKGYIRGHIHYGHLSPMFRQESPSFLGGFDVSLGQCQARFVSGHRMSWFFPCHMKMKFLAMHTDISTLKL